MLKYLIIFEKTPQFLFSTSILLSYSFLFLFLFNLLLLCKFFGLTLISISFPTAMIFLHFLYSLFDSNISFCILCYCILILYFTWLKVCKFFMTNSEISWFSDGGSKFVLRRPFDTRLEHVDLPCLLNEMGVRNTVMVTLTLFRVSFLHNSTNQCSP